MKFVTDLALDFYWAELKVCISFGLSKIAFELRMYAYLRVQLYRNINVNAKYTWSFILDGTWMSWSTWTSCNCMQSHFKKRSRECSPPKYRGSSAICPSKGAKEEEEVCCPSKYVWVNSPMMLWKKPWEYNEMFIVYFQETRNIGQSQHPVSNHCSIVSIVCYFFVKSLNVDQDIMLPFDFDMLFNWHLLEYVRGFFLINSKNIYLIFFNVWNQECTVFYLIYRTMILLLNCLFYPFFLSTVATCTWFLKLLEALERILGGFSDCKITKKKLQKPQILNFFFPFV